MGNGVTSTSFIQHAGQSVLYTTNAEKGTVKVRGGICECFGNWTTGPLITVNKDATLLWSADTAAVSQLDFDGTFDTRKASTAPNINAFFPTKGAVLKAGTLGVAFSTGITEPDGIYTVTYR